MKKDKPKEREKVSRKLQQQKNQQNQHTTTLQQRQEN